MQRPAQDLKCGDVFRYRNNHYLTLLNFTDSRHAQTIITAVLESDYNNRSRLDRVTSLRLLRSQHLEVVAHHHLDLIKLEAQVEELTPAEVAELDQWLGQRSA